MPTKPLKALPALEELIPLTDAANLLPKRRDKKPVHVSCLYRWSQRGLKGIILETTQCGGTRCTSRTALAQFFARLAGSEPAASQTVAGRKREIERAERELADAGI
jgi:hypothetical protein